MNIAIQWRQHWLSGQIVVEFSQQVNGIAQRGLMRLHSGAILELEGSISPIMIHTLMLLHGLREVRWNENVLSLHLSAKQPDVRPVTVADKTLSTWSAPKQPVPSRTLHVRLGKQNMTDYSWYSTLDADPTTMDEYGAIRLGPDQEDTSIQTLRVVDIKGPMYLCTEYLPCPLDVVMSYMMSVNGTMIRAKDRGSILLPGKSRLTMDSSTKSVPKEKVMVVEYLYAGRGY